MHIVNHSHYGTEDDLSYYDIPMMNHNMWLIKRTLWKTLLISKAFWVKKIK